MKANNTFLFNNIISQHPIWLEKPGLVTVASHLCLTYFVLTLIYLIEYIITIDNESLWTCRLNTTSKLTSIHYTSILR